MRLLHDRRPHRRAAGAEVAADGLDLAVGPDASHHVDRLVGELVALVEVDAERGELRLQVAGRDAEDHPSAREHVEAQHRLRGEQRIAVGEHEDVRLHADPVVAAAANESATNGSSA